MPIPAACRANAALVQLLCNRYHAYRPVGQNAADHRQNIDSKAVGFRLLSSPAYLPGMFDVRWIAQRGTAGLLGRQR